MQGHSTASRRPVLWVTYAWVDNDEGDFDYLVQELEAVGIEVRFDKVRLIPGQRLWEQIGDEILAPDDDGTNQLITSLLRPIEVKLELLPIVSRLERGSFAAGHPRVLPIPGATTFT